MDIFVCASYYNIVQTCSLPALSQRQRGENTSFFLFLSFSTSSLSRATVFFLPDKEKDRSSSSSWDLIFTSWRATMGIVPFPSPFFRFVFEMFCGSHAAKSEVVIQTLQAQESDKALKVMRNLEFVFCCMVELVCLFVGGFLTPS